MPVWIDMDKALLMTALEKELACQIRLSRNTKQPAFIPIIEKDIAQFRQGLGSLKEVK